MAFQCAAPLRSGRLLVPGAAAHSGRCARRSGPASAAPARRVRAALDTGPAAAAAAAASATGNEASGGEAPSAEPLIGACGTVAPGVSGRVVGVFAVLDGAGGVRHVGISRDVATSLRRALARRPDAAHAFRVARFARPSRAALEDTRARWAAAAEAAGTLDAGRAAELWERPVDVNDPLEERVGADERAAIADAQGRDREKALKQACRVIQKDIVAKLQDRGLTESIKFDPKLKSKGLLDVESVKVAIPDQI